MKHANISLFAPHAGCPHQCSFCNQKTISGSVKPLTPEDVASTLLKASEDNTSPENTEIAFFGGSFTAIERGYMESLLQAAFPFVKNGRFAGIRISTRPDAISDGILTVLKQYGVTSIELGAQSMDDEVLLLNRRGHTAAEVVEASEKIRQYGFSLGLQMMTGLYGDTDEKCVQTAEKIIAIHPDTVRIYPTVILEGTYLGELYQRGEYKTHSVDEAAELCAILLKMFDEAKITVIRLGLHSGGNVEEGYLAGPFHPAFGEITESKIYWAEACRLLPALPEESPKQKAVIYVNDREISKMAGQKGCNKAKLLQRGYDVKIAGDSTLCKYKLKIERS